MATLVSGSKEQTWKAALESILPPGIAIPDDDAWDISFATVYSGPRPDYDVPKAETLDPGRLSRIAGSEHIGSDVTDLAGGDAITGTVHDVQSHSSNSSHSPSSAIAQLQSSTDAVVNPGVDAGFMFSSFHLESTEAPPFTEQGDHSSTRSDFRFSGPQSSSFQTSNSNSCADGHSREIRLAGKQPRKKGECCGCLKAYRFQDKESCLVCASKFCSSCILRAMGSMPEGRKCVKCVGLPINESKRPNLGRPSRLLYRCFSPLEVQQIMKTERESAANQLRPEQLTVNGRQLTAQELAELLGCKNPPSQLKPGRYWYDKQSGYWGKEGEKPDSLITEGLNVGAEMQEDASAGSTKVYINNREITKRELKMLKFAGVQCVPRTHLWLYADGSYQDEGQNNVHGNIWEKAATRILCPLFSLPTPNQNTMRSGSMRPVPGYLGQKKMYNILLVGHEGCGTSTIFKQAKFLYKDVKFTREELQNIKWMIQSNIYKYIGMLLEARERFEEEEGSGVADPTQAARQNPYTINAKLKDQAEWILEIMASGDLDKFFPAAARVYAPWVEEVWRDPAIQATYKRKAELHMIPDAAEYFLKKAVDISSDDYEPSDEDILFAEGITQGSAIAETEFSLDDNSRLSEGYSETFDEPSSATSCKYRLIRVDAKGMTEGRKWLEMFEDVHAVLFCVALDDYTRMWVDSTGTLRNKMLLSRELFESVLLHPCFRNAPFILLLNKYDLFEAKIHAASLKACEWFSDFDPVLTSHYTSQQLAQQAYTYIAHKFKKHFDSTMHPDDNSKEKKLYTFQLKAHDRPSVSHAFHFVKEVLKWEETKTVRLANLHNDSMFSDYTSSYSTTVPLNGHQ